MTENHPDTNVGNIEYIRREDASDAVIKHLQLDYEYAWGAREAINALTSADVVPVVHAKWENYSPITIKCSRCGHVIPDWKYSECKYCPNCGAKMDGENKDE